MATVRLQLRRGTEQQWITADAIGAGVVLAPGETGIETDTNRFKFGNGVDQWGELLYANASNTGNTLDDYILTSSRGNPNGVASLDSSGLVPVAQLPASVKVTVSSVADQAARLALTAEPGDIAIQTDSGASYVLQTAGASTNANWKELVGNEKVQDVIGAMLSGNTETGITVTYEDSDGTIDFVVADQFSTHSTSDLSEGTNLYFTNFRAQSALSTELLGINNELDLKAAIASPALTGTPTAPTATAGTNTNQIATTAYTDAAIAALVDTAPGALNTLNEIAAAIGDDANFSGTIVGLVSALETDFLGHSGSPSAHGTVGDIVGTNSTQTLGNKTISGTNNTLSNIPQTAITDLGTTLGSLAPKASPTFTGVVSGITSTMVGLGNVDNVSTATIYSNQYVLVTGTSRTISSTTDKFNVVEFNSSNPITVTIPNDTQDAGWPVGSSVEIRQIGTGQISVTKDAAVTYYAPDSQFKSRVQWSSLFLEKRAANSWLVTGDATA